MAHSEKVYWWEQFSNFATIDCSCKKKFVIQFTLYRIHGKFEGHNLHGFCCTFVNHETFILEKSVVLKKHNVFNLMISKNKPRKFFHACLPHNLRSSKVTPYTVCHVCVQYVEIEPVCMYRCAYTCIGIYVCKFKCAREL